MEAFDLFGVKYLGKSCKNTMEDICDFLEFVALKNAQWTRRPARTALAPRGIRTRAPFASDPSFKSPILINVSVRFSLCLSVCACLVLKKLKEKKTEWGFGTQALTSFQLWNDENFDNDFGFRFSITRRPFSSL